MSPTSAHGSVIVTTTHDRKRSAAREAAPRLKVTGGIPAIGSSYAAQRGIHGVLEELSGPRLERGGLDLKPPFLEARARRDVADRVVGQPDEDRVRKR
jgi:hypothetical protein